ncbi:lipase family protein [Variovorax ureilyticus]|uniref:lipase family protein n=1 Tax=Variovorax ureilyticus TaxID=1836198 RepID=UPI003D677305
MYGFDMCAGMPSNLAPVPDARIAAAGFNVLVGYLSASDAILVSGSGLRSRMFGSSDAVANRVCYGYVASNAAGQYVAVIRGTHGLLEWADDLDFLMMQHPNPNAGLVDQGFWSIYRTMLFHPLNGGGPVQAAQGLGNLNLPAGALMVLGHSLGSALATYLTLDLALQGTPARGCYFASPHTGNQRFVDFFEGMNINYDLWNYVQDKVPTVPKRDLLHFSDYKPLRQEKTIPVDGGVGVSIDNTLPCFHHLICYTALLDPATYKAALADAVLRQVPDDLNCAQCVLSTGS